MHFTMWVIFWATITVAALVTLVQGYQNVIVVTYAGPSGNQIIQCSKKQPANIEIWLNKNETCAHVPTIATNTSQLTNEDFTQLTINNAMQYSSENSKTFENNSTVNITVKSVTLWEIMNENGASPTHCVCCLDQSTITTDNTANMDMVCADLSLRNDVDRAIPYHMAIIVVAFVQTLLK